MTRPRYLNFWLFVGTTGAVSALASIWVVIVRAALIGFDAGAFVFIAGTLLMFSRSETDDMRKRAKENDPDHQILLMIALFIVGVVLVAVTVELTGTGGGKGSGVAIAGATILLAWLFSNLLFAIHYAHEFYSPGDEDDGPGRGDGEDRDRGGLDFPGDGLPDYGDFAYFAFVLGMTFQVSDVEITAKSMRRLALYHSLAAFLFNIVVVALSVSLIGNLIQK